MPEPPPGTNMNDSHPSTPAPQNRRMVTVALAAALALTITVHVFKNLRRAPVESFTVGYSREGTPITAHLIGSGSSVGLFVIATIHGNEGAGTPLTNAFHRWLVRHPDALGNRRVLLLPVANPDGFATDNRLNRNGVDLNRNFPAENRIERKRFGPEALSEPEARAIYNLLERFQPTTVVSIHQPLACIDYDGPAADLAEAMAAVCPLPVKKLGARPGSLGAYVGETLGRPIITLELPKDPPPDLWQTYAPALKTALHHASH